MKAQHFSLLQQLDSSLHSNHQQLLCRPVTAAVQRVEYWRCQPLRKLVEDSLAKKGYISTNGTISPSGKNGANGSRSHGLKVKVGAKSIVKAKSGNASRRKPTRGKAKTSH